MRSMLRPLTAGVASALLVVTAVQAKVSEEEAARLNGKDLTHFGAEVAGNADGSIPAWTGKWKGLPPGLEYGGPGEPRPDPYADEEPLLEITAANYEAHKEHLSDGQQALFQRYPDYRIVVYPSPVSYTHLRAHETT